MRWVRVYRKTIVVTLFDIYDLPYLSNIINVSKIRAGMTFPHDRESLVVHSQNHIPVGYQWKYIQLSIAIKKAGRTLISHPFPQEIEAYF